MSYKRKTWISGEIITDEALNNIENGIESLERSIPTHVSQLTNDQKFVSENNLKQKLNFVTYEDFGAVGDGVTDDGPAIFNAHTYANENKLPVCANGSKTYFISKVSKIPIKTNTNWNGAHFIIDEDYEPTAAVFDIPRGTPEINLTDQLKDIITINKSVKNISLLAGYGNCLVDIRNSNKKQFIRKGGNQNNGVDQTDVFCIDNEGNVLNDIQWDFENVTRVRLYPILQEMLVIENGNFTSIENTANIDTGSYNKRNLNCTRSNVIIRNCSHKNIENEEDLGSPSNGFFYFWGCSNITLENCIVHPRKTRYYSESSGKAGVARGSYEIRTDNSVNIVIRDCRCSDFDSTRWGCHTSNFTKDVLAENCKFNRLDAHQGVYNFTARDCTLIYKGFLLIGGGQLLIENCKVFGNRFLELREDYGSTWNGTITIRNSKHIPSCNRDSVRFIQYKNLCDWDFGYDCHICNQLTIENYLLDDSGVDYSKNSNSIPIIANYSTRNTNTDFKYYFPTSINLTFDSFILNIVFGNVKFNAR